MEEVLGYRDGEIFYTILSFGHVSQLKTKIKAFKYQGTDLHGVFKSHFYFFCPEQTLNFLNFVEWYASNYSSYERVVMDSTKTKIMCLFNALFIRDSLTIPSLFTLC